MSRAAAAPGRGGRRRRSPARRRAASRRRRASPQAPLPVGSTALGSRRRLAEARPGAVSRATTLAVRTGTGAGPRSAVGVGAACAGVAAGSATGVRSFAAGVGSAEASGSTIRTAIAFAAGATWAAGKAARPNCEQRRVHQDGDGDRNPQAARQRATCPCRRPMDRWRSTWIARRRRWPAIGLPGLPTMPRNPGLART